MKRFARMLGIILVALAVCPATALAETPQAVPADSIAQQSAPLNLTAQHVIATQDSEPLVDDGVYMIASAPKSTLVFDSVNGSAKTDAKVRLCRSNFTLGQYWVATKVGDGLYQFKGFGGTTALAYSGKVKNGSNVRVVKASAGNATIWHVQENADGTSTISPMGHEDLAIGVTGGNTANGSLLKICSKDGAKAQKFAFTQVESLDDARVAGKAVANGLYAIAGTLASDRVVGVKGGSLDAGANIELEASNGGLSQKFSLLYRGWGLYSIQGSMSGKYLEVAGKKAASVSNVRQGRWRGSLAQCWYIEENDSGYQLLSARDGFALDVKGGKTTAGTNIRIAKNDESARQTFELTPSSFAGTYVIQTAIIDPMVLSIAGNSKASGANAQTGRSSGAAFQKFKIKHIKEDVYAIQNVGSGLYLGVSRGSKSQGARVQQNRYGGKTYQQWVLTTSPNGGVSFKNVKSGQMLDVAGGSRFSGAKVQQYSENGADAQRFYLKAPGWKFYSGATASALRYIAKAEEYEGWPYAWGGRGPSTSFDCAGLVMYCANATLGKHYDLLYTNASMLSMMCKHVSASEARPGDLVFYRGTYGSIDYISHVVIYCGNGIMYGAGDPIGYARVDSIRNIEKKPAAYFYARM